MRHSEQVDALIGTPRQRQDYQRSAAGALILERLLTPAIGPLAAYEFRVFIYDQDRKALMPSYEPQGLENSEGWAIGVGAVGRAYADEEYICVKGEACWDGTYDLTPERQQKYRELGLEIVAAMPIRNARRM